jgi:CDP-diacylglycerol--glycerol-3-phosphate 3-phosphatidyltransferase
MAKYIPNMLSMLRIILGVLLIPLVHSNTAFIAIYFAIGATDVLDGLLARKLECESDFGAKLDSTADFTFYSIFVYIFLKLYISIIKDTYIAVLIVVIFIRIINMLLTKLKYGKIVFIHTLMNKTAGFLIFLLPIIFIYSHNDIIVWTILIIALIASIEELLITVKYKEPYLNRKSIFIK